MPGKKFKRFVLILAALMLVGGVVVTMARARLLAAALHSTLRAQGAEEVRLSVGEATPWRVVVADLALRLAARRYAADRITFARDHWWSPTLGSVRVEGAQVPVVLAASASSPATGSLPPPALPDLPVDAVSLDGQLLLQAGDAPDQALAVELKALRHDGRDWRADGTVKAPGLDATVDATWNAGARELVVRAPSLRLEAAPLLAFASRVVALPSGPWEAAGVVTGQAGLVWNAGGLVVGGQFRLADGRLANPTLGLVAEGLTADVDVTDFQALRTKPARVRVRELQAGRIRFADLAATVELHGADLVKVADLQATALGGAIRTEPFALVPSRAEFEAVVSADGLDADQIMALTQDLPARVSGRVSGRLPVRYDAKGLRFGTGWLGLKPGVAAEVQFHAEGLLTAGASPATPSYAVLKKIETGLLRLRVNELRLDIRPPNAPGNRTAQLHVKGEPVDPEVKAPVTLDLNVNGPLESLLNLGLKGAVSVGTKP